MSSSSIPEPVAPDHLNAEEVLRIIDFMADSDPIIVGGQSVNIWADYYADVDKSLDTMGPFTSKDVDFFANSKAVHQLAARLENSKVLLPTLDDTATPNAAVVVGDLGERRIIVDFMAVVLGVDNNSIVNNYVAIEGTVPSTGKLIKLCLLHPLDCVRSRLANINVLHRNDDHSVRQAVASLKVLEHFVDDLLDLGDYKNAQKTLHAIPYVVRDMHLGEASFVRFGAKLDFFPILERYVDDERLDKRWRELYFKRSIDRLRDKINRFEERRTLRGSTVDGAEDGNPPQETPTTPRY